LIELDDREYQLRVAQAEAELAQARAAIGLSPAGDLDSMDPMSSPPVREARAILDEARKQAERMRDLFEQDTVVATDLEAAMSAAEVAEARFNSALNGVREKMALVDVQAASLDVAQQQLADTRVAAPFAGSIRSRSVAVGTYVQAGQPMIELVRTSVLRFRASVPERFAQELQAGQLVRIARGNRVIESTVSRISPVLDPLSRSLAFEAVVDNADGDLRSGLFGEAVVVLNPEAVAISIPEQSLIRFAGVDKVWCVSDGMVLERVVTLGREVDGRFEITSGLEVGDRILLDAQLGRTAKLDPAVDAKAVSSRPTASNQNNSVR
jgi:RND family efflux transporter MFP subunit